MVVVVTFASGSLGRHVVDAVRTRGHEVRELRPSDLVDRAACEVALRGAEVVVHLPPSAQATSEGISAATSRLLEAAEAAGGRRVVLLSTARVHRAPQYGASEDTPRDPRVPAGAAEEICERFWEQGRLETVIVRPGVFGFGPGSPDTFGLLERLSQHKRLLCARGRGVTTTAYVENLAHGLALAADVAAAAGRIYLIDDGEPLAWYDLFDRMTDLLETKPPRYGPPLWVGLARAAVSEAWAGLRGKPAPLVTRDRARLFATDFYFRSARAAREIGYAPKVGLREALGRTVDWYKIAPPAREKNENVDTLP